MKQPTIVGLTFNQKSSSIKQRIKQAVIVGLNFNQKSVIVGLNINKISMYKSGTY